MPTHTSTKWIGGKKIRHIVEIGLALLAQSNIALSYWDVAFGTAIFLINRLPTPVIKGLSPYEILFQRKPDYIVLRTFGCACFPYIWPYNKNKLSFHTIPCVFIGYSRNHKGYKCFDPLTKQIYMSHHVVFDEMVPLYRAQ